MKHLTFTFAATLLLCSAMQAAQAAPTAHVNKGKQLYERNCAACHGKQGEGRGTAFPPLYRSDYIMNKPQVLAASITKGINGPIKVNGKSYNGFMPAIALNDADAAAIATYVMNAFDNGGGTITEQHIRQSRHKK
ncbi:c-type cytochrome [Neisseria animalis]|uniref:Cytochrome c n=1 Tax=Neisseria animalis TaxID=492 RepID=A0A5P3MRP7_NEIAN|nr:cytochrome c [Neisseria animalis]QEY24286.1 cytochrome c [Neisseria animalis]ROW32377.1 cytochrome c [Neisseria animalis]VEE06699.1 cytochrome [Neisseria animalis]